MRGGLTFLFLLLFVAIVAGIMTQAAGRVIDRAVKALVLP